MFLYLYIFLYCNADILFNKLYLSNYYLITDNTLINQNEQFYYSIMNQYSFVICIYIIFILNNYLKYNSNNKITYTLMFIYLKYILNCSLTNDMSLSQYESCRNIMWLFSTPLMLKSYCIINHLNLNEIGFYYHIIPTAINIFIYPYKNTLLFYYFTGITWIMLFLFLKNLYKKRHLEFTNIYIFIWSIFIFISIIDTFNLSNIYSINIYYSYADMISKLIMTIIVFDYHEKEIIKINSIDLQSIQFISYMIKNIKKYKEENAIITLQCNNFITNIYNRFLVKVNNDNNNILEQELLRKILPLNFDKDYIETKTENEKQFNMICVLFTDIVNYSELASRYDDKTIFKMLNNVYNTFDNIIKKYSHLQKIETIGDAYMVVGDIFRSTINHKIVIKEIILFAFDILRDIKSIKTPDNIPLSLRIGINIGNVTVGVLGNEIPRLCVVGNTVNKASRLQSTADIDTIQLSRHIYEQLEDLNFDVKLNFEIKENVFLKNLGTVTTYNIKPIANNN